MRGYRDDGIILARRNFEEAGRIIDIFTKRNGKVSVLAKGVRKPKSRKRGHLEIFSKVRFWVVTTRSLDLITEVETLDVYNLIRGDLKKTSVAYFLVEVVNKLTREGEGNRELYNLLERSLEGVESTKTFRYGFIEEILILLGFWPQGKSLGNADAALEHFAEREISSVRVGKKLQV